MKPWIIITAMAALALTVFAIAEAQDDSGADLAIRLSGSNLVITTENRVPTPNTEAGVTMGLGIAKGSGSATFQVRVTFDAPQFSPSCQQDLGFPFGADITQTNLILTYNDGSILELFADSGSLCGDGTLFVANLQGTVAGGEGRFDGASGTWSAVVEQDSTRITGDIEVGLN
jgi:hypothetical protein